MKQDMMINSLEGHTKAKLNLMLPDGSLNEDVFEQILKMTGYPLYKDEDNETIDRFKFVVGMSMLKLPEDVLKSCWTRLHLPTVIKYQDEDVVMELINNNIARFIVACKFDIINTLLHGDIDVRDTALSFMDLFDYEDISFEIIELFVDALLKYYTKPNLNIKEKVLYNLYLKNALSTKATMLPIHLILKYIDYLDTRGVIVSLFKFPDLLIENLDKINKYELEEFRLGLESHEPYPSAVIDNIDILLNVKEGDVLYLIKDLKTGLFMTKLYTDVTKLNKDIDFMNNGVINFASTVLTVGGTNNA